MAWLEEEAERPSRADWYAMQIAMEVHRGRVSDPSSVKLTDKMLKRAERTKPAAPLTKEEATARAQSRWFGMLGVKKEKSHGA